MGLLRGKIGKGGVGYGLGDDFVGNVRVDVMEAADREIGGARGEAVQRGLESFQTILGLGLTATDRGARGSGSGVFNRRLGQVAC